MILERAKTGKYFLDKNIPKIFNLLTQITDWYCKMFGERV